MVRQPRSSAPLIALALALDAGSVLVFAAAGRSSHAREATLAGLIHTAWPFLAALALSWLVTLAWRAPARPLWPGLGLWLGTLGGGMALRALAGQGVALPFVLVAAGSLLAFLVGWRLVAAAITRLRRPAARA